MDSQILEIVTGRPLVIPTPFADRADVLREIKSVLGPLPSKWTRGMDKRFRESMAEEMKERTLEQFTKLAYNQDARLDDLEDGYGTIERIRKANHDLDDIDLDHVVQMISSVLKYEPEERCSPGELLLNPWLDERGAK
jgi:hypothetical protein